ncbi:MAG: hypothetical protein QXT64_08690 [Desulfurococcaceae archaeon]
MVGEIAWLLTPESADLMKLTGNFPVTGNYPRKRMRSSNGQTTINFPVTGKFPVS